MVRADRTSVRLGSAGALAGILDCLSVAIFVVDAQAKVTFCNAAARELARAGSGIRVRGRRLGCEEPDEQTRLREWIAASVGQPGLANGCPLHAVHRSSSVRPLHLFIRSLTGDHGSGEKQMAIFTIDPDLPVHSSAEVLRILYHLSPAESRVVSAIATASDTAGGAAQLGLSENTFRTHLKSIFHKTGTHRRSELVRLLSGGLAMVDIEKII